jgi:hypothetical protein
MAEQIRFMEQLELLELQEPMQVATIPFHQYHLRHPTCILVANHQLLAIQGISILLQQGARELVREAVPEDSELELLVAQALRIILELERDLEDFLVVAASSPFTGGPTEGQFVKHSRRVDLGNARQEIMD